MFGLFQSDLPIGRRLWILLLILVITGGLSNTAIFNVSDPNDAIGFATQVLLFYGFATIIHSVPRIVAGVTEAVIRGVRQERMKVRDPYVALTRELLRAESNTLAWVADVADPAIFVAGILIALCFLGTAILQVLGTFGLILVLLDEILPIDRYKKRQVDLLRLEQKEPGKTEVRLLPSGDHQYESVREVDCWQEVSRLLNSGWEVAHWDNIGPKPVVLMQRSQEAARMLVAIRQSGERSWKKPEQLAKGNEVPKSEDNSNTP